MGITILSDLAFHSTLAATQGAVLVVITAPQCGACYNLKTALLHYQQDHPLPIFELDAVMHSAIVNELEIFHLPALFLYRDGVFHCELNSEPHPRALQQAIQYALLQPAQEAP